MARQRNRAHHIAVFGESGSGKTVLVSSFYGPTQEGSYANDLWDLVADDTGQGNRLYQNFLGMRDEATAPIPTRFSATTYAFTVKLKGGRSSTAKRRPDDDLKLAWHDYPGEWFEESPSSDEEARRRIETFRSLLCSDVAIVLIDAQKLLDYRGQEEQYLKSLMTNFRQGILRLQDDLVDGEHRLAEFPRIWILALSKADLFPDWDVDAFRDLVIGKAAQHIERLRETLQQVVETPEALSIGEDFMLLSSARFERSASEQEPVSIDVSERVGLDLILPVASLLPLERRVSWGRRMEIPREVLATIADRAEVLSAALNGGKFSPLDRVVSGRFGPLAGKAAASLLVTAVERAGAQLREKNAQARAQQNYLTATVIQFKLDLQQGTADKLIRGPK